MSTPIAVSIAADAPAPAGAPVGLVVEVRNQGAAPVELDLPYPAPMGLRITSADGRARELAGDPAEDRKYIPLVLAPGQSQRAVHALDRWLRFPGPGRYPVDVHLAVHADRTPLAFDQRVTVEILAATEGTLRAALDRAAAGLASSDRLERAMAVEALVHLTTPAAIPYLERVLALDDERADAMTALGHIATPAALDAIERALPGGDARAVTAGLAALAAARRMAAAPTLAAILDGRNDAAIYACLQYLLEVGTVDQAPLVAPLTRSANPAVADLARRFLAKVKA